MRMSDQITDPRMRRLKKALRRIESVGPVSDWAIGRYNKIVNKALRAGAL